MASANGSSTLAAWIQKNLDKDAASEPSVADTALVMSAAMFADSEMKNYYLDRDKWLAVNPDKHKQGSADRTFPFPTGVYHVTLQAVGESDGQSTYELSVDEQHVGDFKCPLSSEMFEEGAKFHKTWPDIKITEGAIIHVKSRSRLERWRGIQSSSLGRDHV